MSKVSMIVWVLFLAGNVMNIFLLRHQARKTGTNVRAAFLSSILLTAILALGLWRELLGEHVPEWVDWAFGIPLVALLIVWLGIVIVRLRHYLQHAWWLNEWKKK